MGLDAIFLEEVPDSYRVSVIRGEIVLGRTKVLVAFKWSGSEKLLKLRVLGGSARVIGYATKHLGNNRKHK